MAALEKTVPENPCSEFRDTDRTLKQTPEPCQGRSTDEGIGVSLVKRLGADDQT